MKNIEHLITCGDSFTEGHEMGETASWAYWTADGLNTEVLLMWVLLAAVTMPGTTTS